LYPISISNERSIGTKKSSNDGGVNKSSYNASGSVNISTMSSATSSKNVAAFSTSAAAAASKAAVDWANAYSK
jgi:hypothetical protein